ncbi:hypothetical protein [Janibacter indicus]|uniref:hypothetical protein n=1 Tax=Janibacter indicus TaxID=857417 RepID=UPI003D9A662C
MSRTQSIAASSSESPASTAEPLDLFVEARRRRRQTGHDDDLLLAHRDDLDVLPAPQVVVAELVGDLLRRPRARRPLPLHEHLGLVGLHDDPVLRNRHLRGEVADRPRLTRAHVARDVVASVTGVGQPPVGPQLDRQVLAVPDDVALDLGRVVAAEDPAEPTGDEGEDTRAEHPDEDEHPDDLEHEDTGARSGLGRQIVGCGHGAIVADRASTRAPVRGGRECGGDLPSLGWLNDQINSHTTTGVNA